ncbi:MAG TPA: sulfate ABC transporter permease subunit CysT [Verrucomicrobiae bacterium]|nr:sulfate ABC transporter permease subunit CysT [Verrucomicrobiae bacterium]
MPTQKGGKIRVLPGFKLTLGYTLLYLGLIVVIPLAAAFAKAGELSWVQFCHTAFSPQAMAAYRLSFGASFCAAFVNAVFGLIIAWVLVRYEFIGKRFMDALVDLPFALPTAVAGITLATLYAPNGWIGHCLAPLGITVSYTRLGVFVALTFVGLPFVVRTVQPVLADLDPEIEEAAASLGANRWQTIRRIVLPMLSPAMLTGFALAFARSLGEYGSVVFISSNIPMKTQIVPLLIMSELDSFEYARATALAVVMLVVSFALLLAINLLQWWSNRHNASEFA